MVCRKEEKAFLGALFKALREQYREEWRFKPNNKKIKSNYTFESIKNDTGIPVSSLRNYEKGTLPPPQTFLILIKYFNYSPSKYLKDLKLFKKLFPRSGKFHENHPEVIKFIQEIVIKTIKQKGGTHE